MDKPNKYRDPEAYYKQLPYPRADSSVAYGGTDLRHAIVGDDIWWVFGDTRQAIGLGPAGRGAFYLRDDQQRIVTAISKVNGRLLNRLAVSTSGMLDYLATSRCPEAIPFRNFISITSERLLKPVQPSTPKTDEPKPVSGERCYRYRSGGLMEPIPDPFGDKSKGVYEKLEGAGYRPGTEFGDWEQYLIQPCRLGYSENHVVIVGNFDGYCLLFTGEWHDMLDAVTRYAPLVMIGTLSCLVEINAQARDIIDSRLKA